MRLLLMAALLALAFISPGQAASVTLSFPDGFSTLHVVAEQTFEGTTAADMRAGIDRAGNQDGRATQAEVDSFVDTYKADIAQGIAGMFAGDNLTLDGERAAALSLTAVNFVGAAGPTTSDDAITLHLVLDLQFLTRSVASHTLVSRNNGTVAFTVSAPAGWAIATFSGLTGATAASDRSEVRGTSTADTTIVFGTRSPAAGWTPIPAAVGVLILAGHIFRRTRGL